MMYFTGHSIDPGKLLGKQEVIEHLNEYGAADRTLADFRDMYNDRFGDELIWLYPISEGDHLGGFLMPVQEGFLWLPYDSADKDDGELIVMEEVALLEAEELAALRNGETMGITMDCIDFDDGDFGSIVVNKTLQRVSKKALEEIPPDELMFVFPEQQDGKKSVLILKQPKTEGSCRKVYLTRKNRELILERLEEIKREKEFFGDAYHDFSLLFALPQGWPIEPKLNEKWFKKWQQGSPLELPEVVFHEIRHTSITYKVLVSGGDIKNVGLGAGQTNVQTTEGYNHGFDERQREIARQVENDFWSDGGIDGDQPLEDVRSISLIELQEIIEERTGQEMKSSYEFETSTEYVEYLLDELIKRKSPLAKAPSLALVAHDASPAKRRIVSNL